MSATTYTVASDELSMKVLDGEAIVLDFATGHYFGLNRTGTALWELIQAAPRSAATLHTAVADGHGLDPDEVEPDIRHFLQQLVEDGLVVATEADEPAEPTMQPTGPYLAPTVDRYDKLDDLMLSGE
jgi:PqqD family protein of HPr-rel-A system